VHSNFNPNAPFLASKESLSIRHKYIKKERLKNVNRTLIRTMPLARSVSGKHNSYKNRAIVGRTVFWKENNEWKNGKVASIDVNKKGLRAWIDKSINLLGFNVTYDSKKWIVKSDSFDGFPRTIKPFFFNVFMPNR